MTEADALQRLAEEAFRLGRPDLAGEFLRRAVRSVPPRADEKPETLYAEAMKALNAKRFGEAEPRLTRAIQLKPMEASWHEHLAVLYAQQGRFLEAANTFRIALRIDATQGHRWANLAQAYRDAKNPQSAAMALREGIQRAPKTPELHTALVNVLEELKQPDEALAVAKRIPELFPDHANGWTVLGIALASRGLLAEAIPPFEKAVQLEPELAEAHSNLAAALGKLKRWDECEIAARRAVELNPKHSGSWGNLGNCLRDLGRYDEATVALECCLKLNPNDAEAAGNLALTFAHVGHHDRAIDFYDRSLKLKPDNDEARFNRSLTHLTLGNFSKGWPEYEWRWKTESLKNLEKSYPAPKWDGRDVTGKTVFLSPEQGLGDFLQFIRFAKVLSNRGARVLVQPPPELLELARTAPGIAEIAETPTAEVTFNTYCHLMSLPGLLKIEMKDITGEPYLTAPAERVAKWAERLKGNQNFKVGIAWQGNPKHGGDRWRSVPLELFRGLSKVPGVELFALQKGFGREQLESCDFPITDIGPELENFSDTAGLLMNLDLLISIDSAVVHLAGALGTPVWNAISFNNDWRWFKGRDDTPWYSSMRLFRQPELRDWPGVFREMEEELHQEVKRS